MRCAAQAMQLSTTHAAMRELRSRLVLQPLATAETLPRFPVHAAEHVPHMRGRSPHSKAMDDEPPPASPAVAHFDCALHCKPSVRRDGSISARGLAPPAAPPLRSPSQWPHRYTADIFAGTSAGRVPFRAPAPSARQCSGAVSELVPTMASDAARSRSEEAPSITGSVLLQQTRRQTWTS